MKVLHQNIPTGVSRRYNIFVPVALFFVWLWYIFHPSFSFRIRISWNTTPSNSTNPQPSLNITTPIAEKLDIFDFAPIESESIKSVCTDIEWNENVSFTCDYSIGGVGNIRNSILNCVRYAISAGTGLVVPRILIRNTEDITKIRTGDRTGMDYMFDIDHFVQSLRLSCPKLRVYEAEVDIPNRESFRGLISLVPESLVKDIPRQGLEHPEEWRLQFYEWLDQYALDDKTVPLVVHLGRSYLQYPIYTDGEGFANEFGGIIKFNKDARLLATTAILNLIQSYSLSCDPTRPIIKDAYVGVHLRTEHDAMQVWGNPYWPYANYKDQAALYFEQIQDPSRSNTTVIYLASGDQNEVAKFAQDAQDLNLHVVTKLDLLEGKDKEDLLALAWDQQALVDFLIMLKAADFAGVGYSSFSWNVALKRHTYSKQKEYLNMEGPRMVDDELSRVYGLDRFKYDEYPSTLWP